jgi:phosphoenolpyruvate synthase/pyruvate phosphate dikinase
VLEVSVRPGLVAATAAGVAFTANPVTRERGCVVIVAVAGIGERLASGWGGPDRWIVRGDDAHQYSAGEVVIDGQRAQLIAAG